MAEESSRPPVPTFAPKERVCGNCKLWSAHSVDARGWVGPCRLQPDRGLFPPSAPICNKFAPRGSAAPQPQASAARERAARGVAHLVRRREHDPDETLELELEDMAMTRAELMELIREAVGESAEVPPLAPKWEGGTLKILPGKEEVQGKDIPLDTFFHKIVMVRDRLRVLEQKLNAHPKLTDAEKVELQGYVTRVYGSLTSFNLLFRDKADQFVGAKGEE
jgi:hypothetical protein